jgi:hypothetical protein
MNVNKITNIIEKIEFNKFINDKAELQNCCDNLINILFNDKFDNEIYFHLENKIFDNGYSNFYYNEDEDIDDAKKIILNYFKTPSGFDVLCYDLEPKLSFNEIKKISCEIDIYNPFNKTVLIDGNLFSNTKNITHMKFNDLYNKSEIIPNTVIHLCFGICYNQSIHIPNNIEYLTFGTYFNQLVNIPNSVSHLLFGSYYNQPINIPNSIIYLKF